MILLLCVLSRSVVCESLQPRGPPCSPPEDLPNPGIRPRSPTLQADPLPAEPQGKPNLHEVMINYKMSNTKKSTPLQLAGKQSKIGPNEGEREP